MFVQRIPQHFGPWLSLVGTALTASYVGGTSVALEGTEEVDAECIGVFDAATTLTSIEFRLAVSDDNTNWMPIDSVANDGQAASGEHSITASAGATLRLRLQSENHRTAKYVRIEAKRTGTVKSGDSAASNLNYSIT